MENMEIVIFIGIFAVIAILGTIKSLLNKLAKSEKAQGDLREASRLNQVMYEETVKEKDQLFAYSGENCHRSGNKLPLNPSSNFLIHQYQTGNFQSIVS